MSSNSFVHLHCHTHYSLLDGATRITDLVKTAKEMGMPAIAITDHGNMFGAVEFYLAAISAGVKPILGLEAYIAPGDRRLREGKGTGDTNYHLLLLAMNNIGYQNLLKLTSIGFMEGFYYKPRIDREVLEAHSEGLICTSTCLGAEIPQALIKHDRAAAEAVAEWYLKVFGPDRFFIELQDHGIEEQRTINPELIDIAKRQGVGMIVTNDVHYLKSTDVEAHDILCCISTRALQSDTDRFKFPTDQFFLKTPAQMHMLFPDHPEASANTVSIAERCNVELNLKKRYTPVYHPPAKQSPEAYLRDLVQKGATERYGEISAELQERIDYELGVIQSKGFSSYFLICWDFVHFARGKGIPCGARGSGCSSVVAYCLYLSQPDPLRYGLYFERFMDPDRDEMPDIDIDICQDGRDDVIRYVREKYGHVAQIITFGTLKAKAAIRDVCRVTGINLQEADRIAKLVPETLGMTLDKALAQEPELKRLCDEDPRVRKVMDVGRRLEGLARNAGVHAAGIVIADQPLDNLLPLYKPAGSDQVITQFEGTIVEKVGLLKMDLLGLQTLSVLARACDLIEQNHGIRIDLEKLNLEDAKVYEIFAAGQTAGVFQFESGGMRDVLMKMRPNRIEDLIAANALYRPGPMVNIDAYVSRKHGERWTTPHKIMSEVLAETYGIIVYQEQVARLVNQLGGIERKRAFRLAKAISKKKTDMIEKEREPFVAGSVANGVAEKTAQEIFNQILPFGEYAFNKAHSTGYALVAFQTGYLKTYYPVEFMAAVLTFEMGNQPKVVEYIEECRRLSIDVRPPDVNSSHADFTVVREAGRPAFLRFGLAAIKGVGVKAVDAISAARADSGPFRDIFDFCERVDVSIVNKGVIEAMIKAGAFDSTGAVRKALTLVLESALEAGQAAQRDRASGQMSMFGGGDDAGASSASHRIGREEWTEAEMLAHEKSVLGFYVTKHPLASHADAMRKFATADCADIVDMGDGTEVVLGGMISRMRSMVTKFGRNPGSKMAALNFEDLTGSIEAIVYSEDLEKHRDLIGVDKLLFLRGRIDRKRETPSLKVTDIIALEDGPARLAEAVIISISTIGADRTRLELVREALKAHPGDRPVYIKVTTPDELATIIRCEDGYNIRPDESFRADLAKIVGDHAVEILGMRRRPKPVALPQRAEADWPSEAVEELAAVGG